MASLFPRLQVVQDSRAGSRLALAAFAPSWGPRLGGPPRMSWARVMELGFVIKGRLDFLRRDDSEAIGFGTAPARIGITSSPSGHLRRGTYVLDGICAGPTLSTL